MKGKIVQQRRLNRNGDWEDCPEYLIDGRVVNEKTFLKHFPDNPCGAAICVPKRIISDALAVHPGQIPEAIEDARRKGVAVEFLPDGRAVFASSRQAAEYQRAYGFYNRDGGYSDAMPGQSRFKDAPKYEVNPNDYTDAGVSLGFRNFR